MLKVALFLKDRCALTKILLWQGALVLDAHCLLNAYKSHDCFGKVHMFDALFPKDKHES
jgi:hypothetical protein